MAYAVARDCRWTITQVHWRPIHCTFHLCFAQRREGAVAMAISADAPVVALSATSLPGEELMFIDDTAFGPALTRYAPSMHVLPAAEVSRELSDADVEWLKGLGA